MENNILKAVAYAQEDFSVPKFRISINWNNVGKTMP